VIIHDFEQYTPEWYAVRLGIPTASGFDSIFTATGKESTSADTYMHKLLAEWLTGKAEEGYTNAHMERGKELEAEARSYYEFATDAAVRQVGFISTDDGLCGCSPDGMTEGGLEIKCPSPGVHVQYLLTVTDDCPAKYRPQVQGSMMVTGAAWWDFLSYHPDMQPVLVRVNRDEEYIKAMRQAMGKFIAKMLAKREQLNQLRAAA
jgi:hypothetical protein